MKANNLYTSEKKAVNNLFNSEMVSAFQVKNFINRNLDTMTETGLTVREILVSHGFSGKKIDLKDLFQVETESGLKPCYLKRLDSAKNVSKYKLRFYETKGFKVVLLGSSYYYAVPCENTVNSFFDSLLAVERIKANREDLKSLYSDLFEKIAKKNEKKTFAALKKAKKARNKAVKVLIPVLKEMERYKDFSKVALAKEALIRYYNSVA